MGITGGLVISGRTLLSEPDTSKPAQTSSSKSDTKNSPSNKKSDEKSDSDQKKPEDDDNGNIGYHIMSEDELLDELNEAGEALYNSLSKEGKELARKVASQRCNGTNECKGLNACKTDDHACAGHGSCKGQSKCGLSDKNLAVKIAAMKMAGEKKSDSGK